MLHVLPMMPMTSATREGMSSWRSWKQTKQIKCNLSQHWPFGWARPSWLDIMVNQFVFVYLQQCHGEQLLLDPSTMHLGEHAKSTHTRPDSGIPNVEHHFLQQLWLHSGRSANYKKNKRYSMTHASNALRFTWMWASFTAKLAFIINHFQYYYSQLDSMYTLSYLQVSFSRFFPIFTTISFDKLSRHFPVTRLILFENEHYSLEHHSEYHQRLK